MKTLILYATKHGAAHEIAQRIAEIIGGAAVHDLRTNGAPAVSEFDCVIIGSSVYVGSIHKEAKAFLTKNADSLSGKTLGLFLSGLEADKEETLFKSNFSADILNMVKAKSFLGGIFDPKKAGVFERFVMKAAAKQSAYISTISDEKIRQFAEAMVK